MSFADQWKERASDRMALLAEHPRLLQAILEGGQFAGDYSAAIANRMYSRRNRRAVADAVDKMTIETHGEGVHLIRFPLVNVAAFETDDGLVLIDCGFAPAGPALVQAIETIGAATVHTIVFTHFHADHAFGAWALFEAGHRPRIVASDAFETELGIDLATWGLNVRYTNQNPDDVPRRWDPAFTPTETFHGTATFPIGGLDFELHHARGETADQLWAWVPERSTVVSADYYQPFLPNAGNGKRRQRHLAEWAAALTAMADRNPDLVLPMHGAALTDTADIQDRLRAHADLLGDIDRQVLDGLNAGLRRDLVVDRVRLAERFAQRSDVAETYSTVRDIARMAAGQYTGWWDDIPSHWSPAPFEDTVAEIARLAGGSGPLIERARELVGIDARLACQLADWAHFGAPDDHAIRRAAIEIYIERVARERTPTQEALVYLDHLAELRAGLRDSGGTHD